MSDFLSVGNLGACQQYQALTGPQRQAVDAMVARAKGIGGDVSRVTTAELAQDLARQEAAAAFLRSCIDKGTNPSPKPSTPGQPTVGGFNVTRPHVVTARPTREVTPQETSPQETTPRVTTPQETTPAEIKPQAPTPNTTRTEVSPQEDPPAVPQRTHPDGQVHRLTDANFDAFLRQHDGPVMVDFYADWCGPCRALAPRMESVAGEREAAVGKVNVDFAPDVAKRYGVRSLPTVMTFLNGEPVGRQTGLQSESGLRSMIRQTSGR